MFELYKRAKPIGRYSSIASAKAIAFLHRGEERAQLFTIRKGRKAWQAKLVKTKRARWKQVS